MINKKKQFKKQRSNKSNSEPITGIAKRHPDGFGFLIPDDSSNPDVYLSKKTMAGVMSSDRVSVIVSPEPGGDRFRGEITEIIDRAFKRVTGQSRLLSDETIIIKDETNAWGEDLIVPTDSQFPVKDGDWVAVDIISYPGSKEGFEGKLVAVIGDGEDPLNDIPRILYAHGISDEFSKACLKEAEAIPIEVSDADKAGRKDMRNVSFITIDGVTAKDFDDAIYIDKTNKGFTLYVAIADVSHYVKVDSAIDQDAYSRGTSTYLPNYVAPMLPEALSNELCSLKPNVDRLSLVAEMHLDFKGELQSSSFYEAVIKSHARVTYGQAQEIIEGNEVDGLSHVEGLIKIAEDLAKILMAKRFKEGSLSLEIPETEVQVDKSGVPVDILKADRLFAHKLIEEMMLMANVAVARFFKEKEIAAIYRVHEPPKPTAIETLNNFINQFGYDGRMTGGGLQKKLTKALQMFSGTPQEPILNILTLRSMNQAKYSPINVGHFGLGFDNYTHFTSPIRRYPDLIVHRLIKALVHPGKGYELVSEEDLASAGSILSACEQRSVKAERQIIGIKKARFIKKFLGEEFDGIISSVAKFGVFVVLRQYDVDGLIRVDELGNDFFEFREEQLALVGKKTKLAFNLGDEIRIQVAKVDTEQGQVDFTLIKGGKKDNSLAARVPFDEEKLDRKKFNGKRSKQKKSKSKSKSSGESSGDKYSKKRGKTKNNSKRVRPSRVRKSGGKS